MKTVQFFVRSPNSMENYVEINTVSELLNEIKLLLDGKRYLGALFLALTLPDSLGKLAYPSIDKVGERYIKWFDENVYNIFGLLYSDPFYSNSVHFDGKACYQLRCKLLHESTNDIAEKTGIEEFVLGFNDQRFFTGGLSGNEYRFEEWTSGMDEVPQTLYLYVGVKEICTDVMEAAERFLANNPHLDYPKLKMNHGGGKFPKDLWIGWPKKNKQ